jgi:hypothetical protein
MHGAARSCTGKIIGSAPLDFTPQSQSFAQARIGSLFLFEEVSLIFNSPHLKKTGKLCLLVHGISNQGFTVAMSCAGLLSYRRFTSGILAT